MQFDDLQRQIIMDHYKHPQNRVDTEVSGYLEKRGLNPSCGDDVTVFLLIEENSIKDIKFKGDGCSICCASASIMTNELIGLTIDEVAAKVDNFKQMITGHDFDENLFEDAICFNSIKDYPARFKCAVISWDTAHLLAKGE